MKRLRQLATLVTVFLSSPALACVVGTGTGASCIESALNVCLPSGGSFDGTVSFNCGGAATITVASTKTISANTTIDGASAITISGGNSVGIFSVSTGVNFTVQNLSITNGKNTGDGAGGILSNGGILRVTNSTLSANTTGSGAGAIYNHGGTLTVDNDTFSGNSTGDGGAIYSSPGGTATITNSTFSGNYFNPGGRGGGGIASDASTTLTVIGCTFSGNSGYVHGGGINSGGVVTVTNSTFSGNSATDGGGIYTYQGNTVLKVTNSTFSGNSASSGGAIYNASGSMVTITNSIFATSPSGGNCAGNGVTDGGHNVDDGMTCGFSVANVSLSNTDPKLSLAGLASNGGPTQTIALQAGSPAINAGDESVCSTTTGTAPVSNLDQRGFVRPGVGETNCSIGAYEANSSGPQPWPMFHHDSQRTGVSAADTSLNAGGLKWAFATGLGELDPSALGVISSPAIGIDGTIYVGSYDHNVYAIWPDGTQRWAFATGAGVMSSPALAANGTIYVGSYDHNVYAINTNGSQKWAFTTGAEVLSSPVLGQDGTVYVGSRDHNLYAINPDGTQKWAFGTGALIHASPAIGPDGTIYVGSRDDQLYAINPDGTERWAVGATETAPAVGSDGTIYYGAYSNSVYALKPDGTPKWVFATGSFVNATPAVGTDGTIYVSSWDGNFYAINPDGSQKWAFATAGGYSNTIHSSAAISAEGAIYFGSADGHLYALNPNGTQKWAFATGNAVDSSPAIGVDGTVYVGSCDAHVYALGGPSGPTQTPTGTLTIAPTATRTPSSTPTTTPTNSRTSTPTQTATITPPPAPTNSATITPTITLTPTRTTTPTPPHHDAVVLPLRPLNVTVPFGRTVTKRLHVKVVNADVAANPENIKLSVTSDCPNGVNIGAPQFPPLVAQSDTVYLRPGAKGTAIVPVTLHPLDFANKNHKAASRCTLTFTAATQVVGNADPTIANNTMTVEMNVIDKNVPEAPTAHESLIQSMAPLKVTISKGRLALVKTVRPKVTNADIIPAPEATSDAIQVAVDLSGCSGIPVAILDMDRNTSGGQDTVPVGGGKSVIGTLQINFDSSAVTTRSKLSPTRCTAILQAAIAGNTEPDPTNNSTKLIIDVTDLNDF